jgi:hypothetical protein
MLDIGDLGHWWLVQWDALARYLGVMPALVAGIHDLTRCREEDVVGRNKSGHDE